MFLGWFAVARGVVRDGDIASKFDVSNLREDYLCSPIPGEEHLASNRACGHMHLVPAVYCRL